MRKLAQILAKIHTTYLYFRYKHEYKQWDTGYKPKHIPYVVTCPYGNCGTHFPQFSQYKEKELKKVLERAIGESKDENSYFRKAYKNWEVLTKDYEKILDVLNKQEDFYFQIACDMLAETIQKHEINYIRPILYLSPQVGTILEFQPCCR